MQRVERLMELMSHVKLNCQLIYFWCLY